MITRVLSGSDENLDLFVCTLREGQPIAVPTETVYGLAAPIDNEAALQRVFEIKNRPLQDPLIAHLASADGLEDWADLSQIDRPQLQRIIQHYWPGPLTLILPKSTRVPDIATAGLPTAAFRVPGHPVMRAILERLGTPLAAPSANPFQYISPTRPEHVEQTLGGKIPIIVDGGPCREGIESTILDLSAAAPIVRRPGPIDRAQLETLLGHPVALQTGKSEDQPRQAVPSPGNFEKHYAPRKPTVRIETTAEITERDSVIDFAQLPSSTQDLRQAFYATLIAADQADSDRIALINWPEHIEDEALADRVARSFNG